MDNLGWFAADANGQKEVADANQYGMFAAVRSTQPNRAPEIQPTGVKTTEMTP